MLTLLLVLEIHHPLHLNLVELPEEVADDGAGAVGLNPRLGEDLGAAHGAGAVVLVPLLDAGPADLVPAAE